MNVNQANGSTVHQFRMNVNQANGSTVPLWTITLHTNSREHSLAQALAQILFELAQALAQAVAQILNDKHWLKHWLKFWLKNWHKHWLKHWLNFWDTPFISICSPPKQHLFLRYTIGFLTNIWKNIFWEIISKEHHFWEWPLVLWFTKKTSFEICHLSWIR